MVQQSLLSASRHPSDTQEVAWIWRPEEELREAADGTLAGLRFAVKDNIDVAGWPTTAACPAFAHRAEAHATVVHRLLAAGAQLAGKANLDQFACGLNGTRSPYGAVPNAFNPVYVSGGSSSGSAVLVAKGEVDFALGTDTAGSGRVPAGLNNIVGMKPTRGLISAFGVVPAAQSVDCVSIFATTVAQAAAVLRTAMGFDPKDPYSRRVQFKTGAWSGSFRFGVPDCLEFFGDELSARAYGDACRQLEALGGTPVTVGFTNLTQAAALLYESALVAERYAAIRKFFDAREAEVIEPVRTIIAGGRAYSAADLCDAQTRLRELAQRVEALFDSTDVLAVPTAPTHYTIAQMQADPVRLNRNLGAYTNFVNLLDYAALSVPSSIRPDGLPFGITLIGPAGSDWQLAELGQRFHHAAGTPQGATKRTLPPSVAIPEVHARTVPVAVVGAHLSGMPLNGQLTERGARLRTRTRTAPVYRFYALPGTTPPKPGLVRVGEQEGSAIEVEVWDMPVEAYGSFVALVPSPLTIGTLQLEAGPPVQGFLCETQATVGALDITKLGGWRAYIASLRQD